MAVRYENQCVGCRSMGMSCHAPQCSNYNVPIWYCDDCGDECVDLYEVDGKELCDYCALKRLPIVHKEG